MSHHTLAMMFVQSLMCYSCIRKALTRLMKKQTYSASIAGKEFKKHSAMKLLNTTNIMSLHSPPNPRWKIIPPSENGKFDMLAPSFIHCKKMNNNYYSRNVCTVS